MTVTVVVVVVLAVVRTVTTRRVIIVIVIVCCCRYLFVSHFSCFPLFLFLFVDDCLMLSCTSCSVALAFKHSCHYFINKTVAIVIFSYSHCRSSNGFWWWHNCYRCYESCVITLSIPFSVFVAFSRPFYIRIFVFRSFCLVLCLKCFFVGSVYLCHNNRKLLKPLQCLLLSLFEPLLLLLMLLLPLVIVFLARVHLFTI